jgi:hypothetical protein
LRARSSWFGISWPYEEGWGPVWEHDDLAAMGITPEQYGELLEKRLGQAAGFLPSDEALLPTQPAGIIAPPGRQRVAGLPVVGQRVGPAGRRELGHLELGQLVVPGVTVDLVAVAHATRRQPSTTRQ